MLATRLPAVPGRVSSHDSVGQLSGAVAPVAGYAERLTVCNQVAALREGVRHRDDQLASLRTELARLEATRDRWVFQLEQQFLVQL